MQFKLSSRAEKLRASLKENSGSLPDGHELQDFQSSFSGSEGFWYCLTSGGWLKPEDLLNDAEQVKKVREAIQLLCEFEALWEELSIEF